jgi:hypothetical protein
MRKLIETTLTFLSINIIMESKDIFGEIEPSLVRNNTMRALLIA